MQYTVRSAAVHSASRDAVHSAQCCSTQCCTVLRSAAVHSASRDAIVIKFCHQSFKPKLNILPCFWLCIKLKTIFDFWDTGNMYWALKSSLQYLLWTIFFCKHQVDGNKIFLWISDPADTQRVIKCKHSKTGLIIYTNNVNICDAFYVKNRNSLCYFPMFYSTIRGP